MTWSAPWPVRIAPTRVDNLHAVVFSNGLVTEGQALGPGGKKNADRQLPFAMDGLPTMSIREIHATTLAETFGALEDLASERGVIFRGHSNVDWRLGSTLARYTMVAHEAWNTVIDDLLTHFLEGLASVGQLPISVDLKDRRSRLEYGRHYGVPSPLIDFTYSPYVATFFAFNGTRQNPKNPDEEVVVYALDTDELAFHWASQHGRFDFEERQRFLYDNREPMFENGYPAGLLKFMGSPASWNKRMQRQLGAFLYDSLDHKGCDLEGDIEKISE